MTVTLERLTHADINLLRELRNANADAFFDGTYITKEAQEDWWHRHRLHDHENSDYEFFTIWLNKVTPVGFLSVTLYSKSKHGLPFYVAEIGNLLLAPAYRGQSIMYKAITKVRRLYSPLTFWIAHVKPTNTASLNVFARQGFIQLDPTTAKESKQCRLSGNSKSTKRNSTGCSASSAAKSSPSR
jgi:RimJ/RimL family protein N-acetyltransferase